jgi:hypothetical protein
MRKGRGIHSFVSMFRAESTCVLRQSAIGDFVICCCLLSFPLPYAMASAALGLHRASTIKPGIALEERT